MSDRRTEVLTAFAGLTPDEAQQVLRRLLDENPEMTGSFITAIAEQVEDVDIEAVAADVCNSLQCLRIEDVWRNAGEGPDGYADPGEVAFWHIESAVAPYLEESLQLEALDRPYDADQQLGGIIMGLHEFEFDIESEVKDNAYEAPGTVSFDILQQWRQRVEGSDRIKALSLFLEQNCPGWENMVSSALR